MDWVWLSFMTQETLNSVQSLDSSCDFKFLDILPLTQSLLKRRNKYQEDNISPLMSLVFSSLLEVLLCYSHLIKRFMALVLLIVMSSVKSSATPISDFLTF